MTKSLIIKLIHSVTPELVDFSPILAQVRKVETLYITCKVTLLVLSTHFFHQVYELYVS